MKSKFLLVAIIFIVDIHAIFGQNEILSCIFQNDTIYGYTCELRLRNANGVNNITDISGVHFEDHGDEDVIRIYSYANRSVSTNIPSIICEKFKNVKWIFLREIGIQVVNEDAFSGCSKVINIQLPNNRIIDIHENALSNNLELQALYLNNNNLTTLPENLFRNQTNLFELVLNVNDIFDLPRNIFKSLKNLKELNLAQNQLRNLKIEWFQSFSNLEILYLNTNQIIELPSHIFIHLRNINRIDLFSNKIRVIHANSFGVLLKLTKLIIYSNIIDFIDERFIDNTEISSLDIRSNSCVNVNISDSTATRTAMRSHLKKCFDNYLSLVNVCRSEKLIPPESELPLECSNGNWDERICDLEKRSDEFEDTLLSEIRTENRKLLMAMVDLQEGLEKQAKLFSSELDEIKSRLTEIEIRPCACS